ncbi:MAG: hypothetical protein R6U64_06645 [Bacteroidales bacterium]
MKTLIKIFPFAMLLVLVSCSSQRQMASRLEGEWVIDSYKTMMNNGSTTTLENAGTIIFRPNGRGSQTFTNAIAQMDAENTGDFRWENESGVVFITGDNADYRKAWIVIDSSRNSQHWRSTDSRGNVQIMQLERKEEEEE